MKSGKGIQSRFNETISVLKNNFLNYLLLNLGLLGIWLILFILIGGLSLLIIIFGIGINYSNFLHSFGNSFNFGFIFFVFVVFVLLFFMILFRILKATMFIGNFYLTKYIDKGEKIKLSNLFILSYKKLYDKALVDFWYFIIYLGVFALIGLLIFIGSILAHSSMVLFGLFAFVSIFLVLYLFVYIGVKYYFADYYCFDNEDFSFKKFKESTSITQKNMLGVFGNILLIMVITYVLSSILGLLGTGFFHFKSISYNSSAVLGLFMSFGFITFIVLKYIFNLLAGLFGFVYMYIYYRFLNLDNGEDKQITEEKGKEQLNVKNL